MKLKLILIAFLASGCGAEQPAHKGVSINLTESKEPDGNSENKFYIECSASRNDWKKWENLGVFRSKKAPEVNNGELMSTAQEVYNGVTFASDGNYDEALIYFGMIWDNSAGVGAELQIAKHKSTDLYLSTKDYKYSLHCEMKEEN